MRLMMMICSSLFVLAACANNQAAEKPDANPCAAAANPCAAAANPCAAADTVAGAAMVAELNKPAPDFAATDIDGKPFKLSDARGKTVVLEWYNPECPFVKYTHGPKGPMGPLAADWTAKGIVWVAINSGAPGKQGTGLEKNKEYRDQYGITYPVLLDESGAIGRMYGAKSTPHMYVINPEGTLVYRGALDNAPLGDQQGPAPVDYIGDCLTAVTAGQAPDLAETKSYGCSVKYGS